MIVFSKTEDHCSQAIKQEAKEAFENNMHHNDTKQTIARAYLSNRECLLLVAVYYNLPELTLNRIFPSVYFVDTNFQRKEFKYCFLKKHLAS